MAKGNIVHSLMLGTEENFVVLPYPDFRTNKAKEARDAVLAMGKTPIKENEADLYLGIANNAKRMMKKHGTELVGAMECFNFWTYKIDDIEINCRTMFDCVSIDRTLGFIYVDDIKTTANANPEKLNRSIIDFGYDIQAFAYISAIENLCPEFAGRVKFRYWFIEPVEGGDVVPVELDGMYLALGKLKWEHACLHWHECLTSGVWPSYGDVVQMMTPPKWELNRWLERRGPQDAPIPF